MVDNAANTQQTTGDNGGSTTKQRIYPGLIFPNNTHPNKLFAFPVIGILIKGVMLIPAWIVLCAVGIVYSILWMITPFVILFTGKYWDTAYKFTLGYLTYTAKIVLFTTGVSDKYPGFSLNPDGMLQINLPKPATSNRLLGFPILGFLIRFIITIPYSIYQTVLTYALYFSIVASWFAVWIKGTYPESLYEFTKDQLRVSLAYSSYLAYLSDTYPSFKISMNHKNIKIILLILGIILTLIDINNQANNFMHMANSTSTNVNP